MHYITSCTAFWGEGDIIHSNVRVVLVAARRFKDDSKVLGAAERNVDVVPLHPLTAGHLPEQVSRVADPILQENL